MLSKVQSFCFFFDAVAAAARAKKRFPQNSSHDACSQHAIPCHAMLCAFVMTPTLACYQYQAHRTPPPALHISVYQIEQVYASPCGPKTRTQITVLFKQNLIPISASHTSTNFQTQLSLRRGVWPDASRDLYRLERKKLVGGRDQKGFNALHIRRALGPAACPLWVRMCGVCARVRTPCAEPDREVGRWVKVLGREMVYA